MNKIKLILFILLLPSLVLAQVGISSKNTTSNTSGWTRSGGNVFLTTASDLVGIGQSPDAGVKLNLYATSVLTPLFRIESEQDGTQGGVMQFQLTTTSPALADWLMLIDFQDNNDTYGRVIGEIVDATSTSEDGEINFTVVEDGTLRELMRISGQEASSGDPLVEFNSSARNMDVLFTGGSGVNPARYDGNTGDFPHQRYKLFDAIAFFPPSANAAGLDTLFARREVYQFDTATAETLYVSWQAPPWFTAIDDVTMEVSTSNTDGDSVGFDIDYLGFAVGEIMSSVLTSNVSDIIDLGTSADFRRQLSFGALTGISANDIVEFRLYRDPSISNDVAADVAFYSMRIKYY